MNLLKNVLEAKGSTFLHLNVLRYASTFLQNKACCFIIQPKFFFSFPPVSWESDGLICAKASFSNVKLQPLFY